MPYLFSDFLSLFTDPIGDYKIALNLCITTDLTEIYVSLFVYVVLCSATVYKRLAYGTLKFVE